jgi:hypothetical protein
MNSIMQEQYPLLQHYQALRNQLMEMLSDEVLAFSPGGENLALGALCREMGEVEQAYVDSFKTFQQDFEYRNEDPGLENSVEALTAWFAALDENLKATLEGLSQEEIENRVIDRGGGFTVLPTIQLHIYKEALLIFYGKASVYVKAMGKTLPEQWRAWIA